MVSPRARPGEGEQGRTLNPPRRTAIFKGSRSPVATSLADVLFALIAVAIAVSQAFILRSTARGMQHANAPRGSVREWTYAIAPAVALVVLLAFAWMAMHPAALHVDGTAPGLGVRG